ncbi:hypothetical protein scyTo_0006618 [Scyliorhinus torazame]|uniref:Uncharacterized protein n=1 Tax=Scyliorhinus torazame TaxID=75743 RepID=A0A401PIY3_SCYTO|nr:hypothetical protein [Scyliorhinus torazame]
MLAGYSGRSYSAQPVANYLKDLLPDLCKNLRHIPAVGIKNREKKRQLVVAAIQAGKHGIDVNLNAVQTSEMEKL